MRKNGFLFILLFANFYFFYVISFIHELYILLGVIIIIVISRKIISFYGITIHSMQRVSVTGLLHNANRAFLLHV
jgi:hypothetical protein